MRLSDLGQDKPTRLFDIDEPPQENAQAPKKTAYLSDLDMTVSHDADMSTDEVNDAIQRDIYKRPRFNFFKDIVAPITQAGLPGLAAKAGMESGLEDGTKAITEPAKGVIRGLEQTPVGAGNLMRWFGENLIEQSRLNNSDFGLRVGSALNDWGNTAVEFWNQRQREGWEAPDEKIFYGSFMAHPSWNRAAALVAEGLPSTATAALVTFATQNPWAGAGVLGLFEGAQEFSQAREAGAELTKANLIFGSNAVVNTLLEKLPLEEYMKGSGALIGAVAEGSQEAVQQWAQNLIAKIGYDKTRSLWEGTIESLIAGAGSGGMIGAFTSGKTQEIDAIVSEAERKGVPYQDIEQLRQNAAQAIVSKKDEIDPIIHEAAKSNITLSDDELFQESPVYYSTLEKVISEKMPNSASSDQVMGILKNSGVKQEEIDWLDIEGFLSGKEKITKAELLDYIRANDVKVEEVLKEDSDVLTDAQRQRIDYLSRRFNRGEATPEEKDELDELEDSDRQQQTKFSQYQLPGGENYKELLLTLPTKDPEVSTDWVESDVRYNLEKKGGGLGVVDTKEWRTNLSDNAEARILYNPHKKKYVLDVTGPHYISNAQFDTLQKAKDYLAGKAQGQLKDRSAFHSSHFDEPNVLAHVRFNERIDSEGKKVLFLEEIQSDWHQQGKKKGYNTTPEEKARYEELRLKWLENKLPENEIAEFDRLSEQGQYNNNGVPNAPFKKTEAWAGLALKRMLRYAAENGYDKIAWTTGEQQAERYDLSKEVDKLALTRDLRLQAYKGTVRVINEQLESIADAEKYVGKEVAQRLADAYAKPRFVVEVNDSKYGGFNVIDTQKDKLKTVDWFKEESKANEAAKNWSDAQPVELSGVDLKVGGEGMKGFYDQIIPSFLNKYTKKWGGRVATTDINVSHKTLDKDDISIVHSLELTPSMKESVMQGQPLFQSPQAVGIKSTFEAEKKKIAQILKKNSVKNVVVSLAESIKTPQGQEAFGSYNPQEKLVKLSKTPIDTTAYHEAFHVLARESTSADRIKQAIEDVMNETGIKDVTQAEEKLADMFAEYANSKGKTRPISKRIVDFFNRILRYIGRALGDKNSKHYEMFDEILKKPKEKSEVQLTLDKATQPISTRLSYIAPALRNSLRRFELDTMLAVQKDLETASPLMKSIKAMPPQDRKAMDLALKNGDVKTQKEIAEKHGIADQLKAVKQMLEDIHTRAEEAGFEMGYIENYIPRMLKDRKGLMDHFRGEGNWSQIGQAIYKKETEIGRIMTEEEKADFINTLIRGYGDTQIKLSKTKNMKERAIREIDDEINKFYEPTETALANYIESVNEAIEARRFFGKGLKGIELDTNLDNIIGAYVLNLLADGKINSANEQELTDILRARFNKRGTHGFVGALKNLAYLDTMGSVSSAITQIGDLSFSMHRYGLFKTGKSLLKSIVRQSEITKEDIGINDIAQEFKDNKASANAVKAVFKLVGFEYMDNLGKETLINSAFDKYKAEAAKDTKSSKHKALRSKLDEIFGDEASKVMSDLKNGKLTDNVKMLLFSELSDFQPVSLSEMPETYLKAGNGRVFYMLKTYSLKQLDVYRREVIDQMATNPLKGIQNLIRLSAALIAMGVTADWLKDFLFGRSNDLPDYAVDNILKLMGFSRFIIYKAKEDGITQALYSLALPPFRFIDASFRDISKMTKGEFEPQNAEIVGSVPIGGKLYYWWFGGGARKMEKKNESIL